jgi:hypothetical protein
LIFLSTACDMLCSIMRLPPLFSPRIMSHEDLWPSVPRASSGMFCATCAQPSL